MQQPKNESKPHTKSVSLRQRPTLTIVIPCYNEEDVIEILLDRIDTLEKELIETNRISGSMQIILVDDGSTDQTWALICKAGETKKVTGLKLSSNQGQQAALLAGLMQAKTDVTVSMDADLQDDPSAVGRMIDAWCQGAEIVYGVRDSRATDTIIKRHTAYAFYWVMRYLGADIVSNHADYRLISNKALSSLANFNERNLFLRGLIKKLGYRSEIVIYDRAPRVAGKTKYSFGKLIALACEAITSLSTKPLRLITWVGFGIAGLSFTAGLWAIAAWALGATVPGWASIMAAIYFLGGTHLIALGIIGEYVGKIYLETKARPRYIIDEINPPKESL